MLSRLRQSTNRDDKGFTLIELLVVMIIIGILAAIAIPVFLSQRQRAVEAGMKSDLRTVANEVESFFVDTQTYPPAANVTAVAGTTTVGTGGVAVKTGSTNTIAYALETGGASYCLSATSSAGATGVTYRYDSNGGGLLAKGAACT